MINRTVEIEGPPDTAVTVGDSNQVHSQLFTHPMDDANAVPGTERNRYP